MPGLLHVGLRCSLTTEPEGAARPPASQATVLAMSSQVETSFLNKKSWEKLQPKKNKSPLKKKRIDFLKAHLSLLSEVPMDASPKQNKKQKSSNAFLFHFIFIS